MHGPRSQRSRVPLRDRGPQKPDREAAAGPSSAVHRRRVEA